jgi:hypothetical protein
MSVKLNRPPKPEESQKDSNFNGKTIPYPGFEPGTSGLAVGSQTTAPFGSIPLCSYLFTVHTNNSGRNPSIVV